MVAQYGHETSPWSKSSSINLAKLENTTRFKVNSDSLEKNCYNDMNNAHFLKKLGCLGLLFFYFSFLVFTFLLRCSNY